MNTHHDYSNRSTESAMVLRLFHKLGMTRGMTWVALVLTCLSLTVVVGAIGQVITASTIMTVVSNGPAQSLLSGCVVPLSSACTTAAGNAGYTVYRTQGFEGSLGANEGGAAGCGSPDTISTNRAHTGTHSWLGRICGDSDDPQWQIAPGGVGTFNDLYVSAWVYFEGGAHIETGNFYFFRTAYYLNGNFKAEVLLNLDNFHYQPNGNQVVSTTSPNVDVAAQSDNSNYPQLEPAGPSPTWNIIQGSWFQTEWHFHDNTCSGNNGNSDGAYEFYINGQKLFNQSNVNLTGCYQTSNGNWDVEVGGVDTVIITKQAGGGCVGGDASSVGAAPLSMVNVNPFSSAPALEADGITPCMTQNNFNRYTDDIIILKK